jgi:anti-sigma regulatory factor (Ser/Thr protein kinase)
MPALRSIPVEESGDVLHVQVAARAAARELGFTTRAAHELAIVASELATNILKYGIKGSVRFVEVNDGERGCALAIVARDCGAAFRDFALALKDGHDDRGPIAVDTLFGRAGMGVGLGAVERFSDSVESIPLTPEGKEVRAVRFLNRR